MTMPAEVTSAADWDRLVATLRAQYGQIDELYQRITDPGDDADEPDTSEEEPMADPSTYPYPGYDPAADEQDAEARAALSVASSVLSSLLLQREADGARSEGTADDRAAEYADEERERLDAETDGRLDGDYDLDVED